MKTIALIAALAASLAAGSAGAADWTCEGEASDWPGTMTVTLTVSDQGRLTEGRARLRLGGGEQFPFAMLGYPLNRPAAPGLGAVDSVTVGAMVYAAKPPKSKTAHIELIVDDATWSRPWGMYADRGWEGEGVEGFYGFIPSEATTNGLGKAIEAGQFLLIRVVGDEGEEVIATRQQALPGRKTVQPLADAAHAKALAAVKDFRNACKLVTD